MHLTRPSLMLVVLMLSLQLGRLKRCLVRLQQGSEIVELVRKRAIVGERASKS